MGIIGFDSLSQQGQNCRQLISVRQHVRLKCHYGWMDLIQQVLDKVLKIEYALAGGIMEIVTNASMKLTQK